MKKKQKSPAAGGKTSSKRPPWMPDLPAAAPHKSGSKKTPRVDNPSKMRRGPPPSHGVTSRTDSRRTDSHRGALHPVGTRHADPNQEREAQRYEHPIPSRDAILRFLSDHGQLIDHRRRLRRDLD